MKRERRDSGRGLDRRSFLGGALAAALSAAAAAALRSDRGAAAAEKPRLPLWIGHI